MTDAATIDAELVHRLPFGVFVLDRELRVLRSNRRAQEFLQLFDGLSLKDGKLTAAMPRDHEALLALLRNPAQGGCRVRRYSGAPPWVVMTAPIRDLPEGHGAIFYVTDPQRGGDASPELLCRAFRFTPAEARLASLLLQGKTPKDAAQALGVSWNTVRTQLRQLFAKTGTDRQVSLVRALLAVAPIAA